MYYGESITVGDYEPLLEQLVKIVRSEADASIPKPHPARGTQPSLLRYFLAPDANTVRSSVVLRVMRGENKPVCVALMVGGLTIATYYANTYPANCGVLIVDSLRVSYPFAGRGLGYALVTSMEYVAGRCGYTVVSATTNGSTSSIEKILSRRGWSKDRLFRNRRSTSNCILWSKQIEDVGVYENDDFDD